MESCFDAVERSWCWSQRSHRLRTMTKSSACAKYVDGVVIAARLVIYAKRAFAAMSTTSIKVEHFPRAPANIGRNHCRRQQVPPSPQRVASLSKAFSLPASESSRGENDSRLIAWQLGHCNSLFTCGGPLCHEVLSEIPAVAFGCPRSLDHWSPSSRRASQSARTPTYCAGASATQHQGCDLRRKS